MSNSNSRMIVFASILGAILATGLLALNPSPMIKNAGAQMYDGQYGYDDNNNYYQDDYQRGYEDDNYYNQDYNDYDDDGYDSNIQLEFADKYGDNYHKDYSKHPTKDHKFVCKTGQFEGFFVKSPMVCNLEIPEGPEGQQGPAGADGQDGAQGPPGITYINNTNVYLVQVVEQGKDDLFQGIVICDPDDFVLNGGYILSGGLTDLTVVFQDQPITFPIIINPPVSPGQGWIAGVLGLNPDVFNGLTTYAYCFDNPPGHMP